MTATARSVPGPRRAVETLQGCEWSVGPGTPHGWVVTETSPAYETRLVAKFTREEDARLVVDLLRRAQEAR